MRNPVASSLLMTTPAILNNQNEEIGEGIMDGVITSLIAIHDLKKLENKNSLYNSIYIVKPKMHGPEEVEFTVKLFEKIEEKRKSVEKIENHIFFR